MTDVVVDGLAVETGQPLGMTGQMQSVQWGAMSVAQILGGFLAGYVSNTGSWAGLSSAAACCRSFRSWLCWSSSANRRHARQPSENLREAWQQLKSGRRLVILLSVGLYLFLWNFNPFSSNVLQHYSTEVLGLSEQFYGNSHLDPRRDPSSGLHRLFLRLPPDSVRLAGPRLDRRAAF